MLYPVSHFHKYLLSLFFFFTENFYPGDLIFLLFFKSIASCPMLVLWILHQAPLYQSSLCTLAPTTPPTTHVFDLQRLEFFPLVHLYGYGIPHPLSQERALTLSDPSSQKQQLGRGDYFPL